MNAKTETAKTTEELATPAQVKFFVSLMLQKMGIELNGSQVEDARNLSKKDISANIEELKGMEISETCGHKSMNGKACRNELPVCPYHGKA